MAPVIEDVSAGAAGAEYGVEVTGLRRSFGDVHAVRGVDMTAPYGEVTALVGPNGAGKTTLLLVLATLLAPDAGTVRVAGADPVAEPRAVRARMGWSPDVFGVPDTLTAREYLAVAAAAHRLPAAARRSRPGELLELVGLTPYADRPTRVLSRGQKQRLGLARALVHSPRVLLLDEPAAGLDPRARVELRDLLRSLAADRAAVVVSSHILADLEELADGVVVVEAGRTVAAHRLDELPASLRPRPWRLRALDPALLLGALTRLGVPHGPPGPAGVDVSLAGDAAVAGLELRQRLRAGRWQLLLGIWLVVLLVVTAGLRQVATNVTTGGGSGGRGQVGAQMYGGLSLFLLVLALLVVPALSSQSVNGDRERGVLAPCRSPICARWRSSSARPPPRGASRWCSWRSACRSRCGACSRAASGGRGWRS